MDDLWRTLTGVGVLVIAVFGVFRGIDVRVVLLAAGLALASLAGDPAIVLRTFLSTLSDEQFVLPICSAMGFAFVLRQSGCDRHLVRMLIEPVRRVRPLLIPGAVAVGCIVNIAVISQASTAVAVGTVVIPLLRSAGLRPPVIGATLLLGASIGGELLNPGAPELQSVVKQIGGESTAMQPILAPLLAIQLAVATLLFWLLVRSEPLVEPEEIDTPDGGFNWFKALVPLVPLAALMMVGPPLNWFEIPRSWLLSPERPGVYASRLIAATMLFGSGLATLAAPHTAAVAAKAFFEGAGYAFTTIVSVIVTANCFGAGIRSLRLADWVGVLTKNRPSAVWPIAGCGSIIFAVICGSGMATTESLFRFFVQSDWDMDHNLRIGAVTSIAAAAGRTTSPAAAVVLLCATLVDVKPFELLRRVWLPLVAATAVTTVAAMFLSH